MPYETDLYPPVRDFLTGLGYDVRAEVDGCDVLAVKGEEMVAAELKLALNLEVILQAEHRQRITPNVYIAVPRPKTDRGGRRLADIKHLLRRLGIGLLFVVSPGTPKARVDIVLDIAPPEYADILRANKRRARHTLDEHKGRHGDFNSGGSNKRKIMTAYREQVLLIARLLLIHGEQKPAALRALGGCEKTASILYRNFDGWFERRGKGVYALTQSGIDAVRDNREVLEALVGDGESE